MNPYAPFLVSFASALISAQDPTSPPIRFVGDRVAATGNSGLQRELDGLGLRGGGAAYRAMFTRAGMRFEPALGRAAESLQHLTLRPLAVQRGSRTIAAPRADLAPLQAERVATYEHGPGIHERFDVRSEGVELSWEFATPPAGEGDLVVRYAVDTSLPAPHARAGGLAFVDAFGGVSIGDVTGIDAAGRRVDGDVRWVEGQLELSLPAAFVASAAYPLVLDPLIGGVVNVSSGLTYDDGEPDAAYDATTGRFLVVWRRTFSATDSDVRGQLVAADGALVGGTIFFASGGVVDRPRVANLGARDRFGVAWSQLVSGTSTVQLHTVEAGNGAMQFTATVATSATTQFAGVDIGSQPDAPIGTARGFVVVYEDNDVDAVRARRYWWNAADTQLSSSAFSVFTDVLLGSTYTQPAIARAAAADGKLLVVAHRDSALTTLSTIEGVVLDAGSNSLGAAGTIVSSTSDELAAPDVDGYAGRWVVAWERDAGGPIVFDSVRAAPVTLDTGSSSLVVGAASSFGGALTSRAYAPSVGYTPGRTWIGYQLVNSLATPTTTLRVAAVDSNTCASCADTFTVGFPDGPRIVVATMTSGGLTAGEDCLAVYHDTFHDINAQRLRNYGTSGGYTNLGGACGASGVQSFNHSPGIGSSGLRNTLSGLPATTLAAIFNFSQPTATSVCGPCVWVPFSITLSPPIIGGSASVEFAIPCLTTLVGAQFETQWTTIDFSQAPCPFFPGLTNSNRILMTIGQ